MRRPAPTLYLALLAFLNVLPDVAPRHSADAAAWNALTSFVLEAGDADSSVEIAQFADSGAGLRATRFIRTGDVMLAIPERLILRTSAIMSPSAPIWGKHSTSASGAGASAPSSSQGGGTGAATTDDSTAPQQQQQQPFLEFLRTTPIDTFIETRFDKYSRQHILLAVFLMWCRRAPADHCPWSPWLATLSRGCCNAICFSDAELDDLHDPVIAKDSRAHAAALRKSYAQLEPLLLGSAGSGSGSGNSGSGSSSSVHSGQGNNGQGGQGGGHAGGGLSAPPPTADEFVWASTTILCRGLRMSEGHEDLAALVPFLDLINHRVERPCKPTYHFDEDYFNNSNNNSRRNRRSSDGVRTTGTTAAVNGATDSSLTTASADSNTATTAATAAVAASTTAQPTTAQPGANGAFVAMAGRDYAAGEQVHICYGDLSSQKLLLHYGFATEYPNVFDAVNLTIRPVKGDAHEAQKADILRGARVDTVFLPAVLPQVNVSIRDLTFRGTASSSSSSSSSRDSAGAMHTEDLTAAAAAAAGGIGSRPGGVGARRTHRGTEHSNHDADDTRLLSLPRVPAAVMFALRVVVMTPAHFRRHRLLLLEASRGNDDAFLEKVMATRFGRRNEILALFLLSSLCQEKVAEYARMERTRTAAAMGEVHGVGVVGGVGGEGSGADREAERPLLSPTDLYWRRRKVAAQNGMVKAIEAAHTLSRAAASLFTASRSTGLDREGDVGAERGGKGGQAPGGGHRTLQPQHYYQPPGSPWVSAAYTAGNGQYPQYVQQQQAHLQQQQQLAQAQQTQQAQQAQQQQRYAQAQAHHYAHHSQQYPQHYAYPQQASPAPHHQPHPQPPLAWGGTA